MWSVCGSLSEIPDVCYPNRVPCSQGWPQICYVAKNDLDLLIFLVYFIPSCLFCWMPRASTPGHPVIQREAPRAAGELSGTHQWALDSSERPCLIMEGRGHVEDNQYHSPYAHMCMCTCMYTYIPTYEHVFTTHSYTCKNNMERPAEDAAQLTECSPTVTHLL